MTTKQTPAEFIRGTLRGQATIEQADQRVRVAFPALSDEDLADAFDQTGDMLTAESRELRQLAAQRRAERAEI